jgi:hypothetical protein
MSSRPRTRPVMLGETAQTIPAPYAPLSPLCLADTTGLPVSPPNALSHAHSTPWDSPRPCQPFRPNTTTPVLPRRDLPVPTMPMGRTSSPSANPSRTTVTIQLRPYLPVRAVPNHRDGPAPALPISAQAVPGSAIASIRLHGDSPHRATPPRATPTHAGVTCQPKPHHTVPALVRLSAMLSCWTHPGA